MQLAELQNDQQTSRVLVEFEKVKKAVTAGYRGVFEVFKILLLLATCLKRGNDNVQLYFCRSRDVEPVKVC